ncbi:MAG: sulfatase-like hydrolase/transferase [Phycisphaeraceae bacterium]|nr:sulfatase-like hydrolase/transferase [Phycisphaeraceae bacterium]
MKLTRLISVVLLCFLANLSRADVQPPNIIFIYADDWGWGDLSSRDHPWLQTPHLDRLAKESIDFQQFNVVNPVCSPSRVAALTGHYPARYCVHQHFATPKSNHERGMTDWLDPDAPTLPRLLKQAGYRTAHFGKWHLTNRQTEGAPTPDAYGYDEASVFNGGAGWPSADLHAAGPDTVAFIRKNKDKPFFINVWLHETHLPHVPTVESMEKHKHLDPQKQVYAAFITDGDNAVGQILDALQAEGLAKNTIVMFSSDNGPENTRPKPQKEKFDPDANAKGYDGYYSVGDTGGLRGRKRSVFEGGVRTPFIVRWPGHSPAGLKNTDTVFTAVDLLPTLCAAAGVELPADYEADGENLINALKGKPVVRKKPIFWDWRGKAAEPDYWPRLVVRQGDWKLVMNDDASRAELYQISEDWTESKDVAKAHPDVVGRLTKLAMDWRATLPTEPDPDCRSTQADANPQPNSKSSKKTTPDEWTAERTQVLSLGKLDTPPAVYEAEGYPGTEHIKAIYFDALSWKGKPTRVFAWLGLPEKREGKVPGVVLVHGGGGTAFKEWVKKWNDRGFAAISIAVEGQIDQRDPMKERSWKRHEWAGPSRVGIYGDSSEALKDQWMFHAVADTVLANSLLRSLPEVDADQVGVMGISWGGVITSTVIGIDQRFAFAIPIYGCGNKASAENQYGRALGDNPLYQEVWDPMVRMERAELPVLWLSWPGDKHFPMDCLAASYKAAPGARQVALIPRMRHGHGPGWNVPDSYAFAKSIVQTGSPWCQQHGIELSGLSAEASFTSMKPLDQAVLVSTKDVGITGERKWIESHATLNKQGDLWRVSATLPKDTTAWFINVRSGELTVSSDYQEITK